MDGKRTLRTDGSDFEVFSEDEGPIREGSNGTKETSCSLNSRLLALVLLPLAIVS